MGSNPHQCFVDTWSASSMLAAKRSVGIASEVNLRNPLHAGKKARKPLIHPGLETQSRHHQRSKTGVSVLSQKRLMFPKKCQQKSPFDWVEQYTYSCKSGKQFERNFETYLKQSVCASLSNSLYLCKSKWNGHAASLKQGHEFGKLEHLYLITFIYIFCFPLNMWHFISAWYTSS